MKKLTLAGAAALALAAVGPAFGAPLVAVTDPTPDGMFTGSYVIANDDPSTPDVNESRTGTQTGYVGVYDDGVVACNGNPEITDPSGAPLQGYIWVGKNSKAASNQKASTQQVDGGATGFSAGAGNNHTNADGTPTGNSPCPDANPSGVNG